MPNVEEQFDERVQKLIEQGDVNRNDRKIVIDIMKEAMKDFKLQLSGDGVKGTVLQNQIAALKTFSDLLGDQFDETQKTAAMVARKKEQEDDNKNAALVADILLKLDLNAVNNKQASDIDATSPQDIDAELARRAAEDGIEVVPGEDSPCDFGDDVEADNPVGTDVANL